MSGRYEVNEGTARWRVVDGEAVVIHSETSYYYGLNPTGTFLWGLLADHARTIDELVDAVAGHYDQPAAAVRPDVQQLVDELIAEDLLAER